MAGFSTISQLEGALKTLYKDPMVVELDEKSGPVIAAIEKVVDPSSGNEFKWAMQYGRSGGIGARGETDDLPTANPRKAVQAVSAPKNIFARISFSDKLIRTSKINAASFANQVTLQMKDITTDAKDMLRRNLLGKSDGVMGTVAAAVTAGKVVTVANGQIKYFYVGQYIDILTDNAGTVTKSVTELEIADVDYDNSTISFAVNVTVTKDQLITLAGNYKNELTGFGEIFTKDTVIYGINRATSKWFNPFVYNKSATFDSMWLQQAIDDIRDFVGEEPNFIVGTSATARAYVDEQRAYKQNVDYMVIDGGYRVLTYNGIPISQEKYMMDGIFDLVTTSDLKFARLADWSWMDEDGKILSRIQNKAAYEGSMVCYEELTCRKMKAHARIKGISL